MPILTLLNIALVALQLSQHVRVASKLQRIQRRYETLISMPERLSNVTWGTIYALLLTVLICDVVAPSRSFFNTAEQPDLLRLLLTAASIAGILSMRSFVNSDLYVSTILVSVQWLALSTLYLFIIFVASNRPSHADASMTSYLLSKLGVIVYAAWVCVEMIHGFAAVMQVYFQACLSYRAYATLLCTLSFISNWTVMFYKDLTFGVVCTWALMLIAVKGTTWRSSSLERLQDNVGETALQLAVMGGTIITIVLAVVVGQ